MPVPLTKPAPDRYLEDALTREEALDILRRAEPGRAARRERLLAEGYPAYTTTPGWLGYDDDKLVRLSKQAVADGFTQIRLKVGADQAEDVRRVRPAREARGRARPVDPGAQRRDHPDRPRPVPPHRRQGPGTAPSGTRPGFPVPPPRHSHVPHPPTDGNDNV